MRSWPIVSVLALAACGVPLWHTPMPRPQSMPAPPSSVDDFSSIEISRNGCLGHCPIYRIRIERVGPARYEGRCHTPLLGVYEAPADSQVFARAVGLLLASDFFKSDTAVGMVRDAETASITVLLSDGRRRAVTYGPVMDPRPEQLEAMVSGLPWRFVKARHPDRCAT